MATNKSSAAELQLVPTDGQTAVVVVPAMDWMQLAPDVRCTSRSLPAR